MKHQGKTGRFGVGSEMAKAIAEILQEKGSCEPRDLEAKGFPAEEIERQWSMAYALARVILGWTDT